MHSLEWTVGNVTEDGTQSAHLELTTEESFFKGARKARVTGDTSTPVYQC